MIKKIKLGDLCNLITDGTHFTPTYLTTGIPFLRVTDITESNESKKFISKEEHSELIKRCHPQKGDILYTKNGTIGVAKKIDWDYEFSIFVSLCLLKPKKEIIDVDYLVHYLNTEFALKQALSHSKKATISNLHLVEIKKIQIPLPPLPVQQKIAAILDAADAYRQKTKALIDKYDQLAQSLFLDMFGDPIKNEKGFEICTVRDLIIDAKYGTSSAAIEGGKYPYLRMNNISYLGYMDYTDLKYIDIPDKDKSKYLVKRGDVLFNRTNSKELVGKTGIIASDDEMIIAGYLIRIRVNELANPYYLWAHLNSKWAKLTLINMCKSIVGMANINAQELQEIKILKAPIAIQNLFAERIQLIEAQKQQAQASLQKAEELFKSLLQRAFNGELVN